MEEENRKGAEVMKGKDRKGIEGMKGKDRKMIEGMKSKEKNVTEVMKGKDRKGAEVMKGKDRKVIDRILEKYRDVEDPAMLILQNLQEELGYTGKEYLEYVSENTGFSLSELYGIVTFYPQLRLHPPGKRMVKVCSGTACHVRGGARILGEVEKILGIKPGETTEDRRFSLESVRCLGCCGLSPVIMIDDETFGRVKPGKLGEIIARYDGGGDS